jgi:hypothetical protein
MAHLTRNDLRSARAHAEACNLPVGKRKLNTHFAFTEGVVVDFEALKRFASKCVFVE